MNFRGFEPYNQVSMKLIQASGVALGCLLLGATALAFKGRAEVKVGSKAMAFSAKGTDGKTHTLDSLSKKGPVFLYFIKEGCPVNHRAAPHFAKLYDAYKGKANFVGVYNGSVEDAKTWQKNYKAKFTILSDADLKIIRGYGAIYSPWSVMVEKGKVSKIMEGGSPKELKQVNELMAKSTKQKLVAMTFDGAPSGGG